MFSKREPLTSICLVVGYAHNLGKRTSAGHIFENGENFFPKILVGEAITTPSLTAKFRPLI
ncbi:hypothetical protein DESC_260016 [Desulfosarcina cetonica]|nr:hypothetical protein DESC_260016 [Desulfosarcina cetonica]